MAFLATNGVSQMNFTPIPEGKITFDPPFHSNSNTVIQMICSVSHGILQATAVHLEESLQEGLAEIGKFFRVDNAYLYLFSGSEERIEKTFEWSAESPFRKKGRFSGMRLCPFTYTMRMVHEKRPMVVGSIDELPQIAKPERFLWECMGTKSLLGNPLFLHGSLIGYFGLTSRILPRTWTDEEVKVSTLLAGLFSNALSRFRSEKRLREAKENELAIAAEIQHSLLSPAPLPNSFSIPVGITTQASLSVDGDFIDLFQNRDGSSDFIMGDSMGKGVPAALLSAATKIAILRARAEGCGPDLSRQCSPEEIVRKVQNEMGAKLGEMSAFVTLAFVRYDPWYDSVQIVNSGHTPILIWRQKKGMVESFDSQNPPLGLLRMSDIKFQETSIDSGDVMLVFSDGLIESRNSEGKFFGIQRVKDILQNSHYLHPQEIVDRLFRLCLSFIGKKEFHDDFSCLAFVVP